MDDLRSLQGMGKILKSIDNAQQEDNSFTRSSSMNRSKVPPKKHPNMLKKTKRKPLSKAYSSRHIPMDFDADGLPITAKFKKKSVPLPEIISPFCSFTSMQQHKINCFLLISGNELSPKSDDDFSISEVSLSVIAADTSTDNDLLSMYVHILPTRIQKCRQLKGQLSNRSVSFGGGFRSLGLDGLDLNDLNDIGDENEEEDWFNDAILKPQPTNVAVSEKDENEKFELVDIDKEDDEKLIENTQKIYIFPSDDFTNYDNAKDVGTNDHVIGGGSFGIVIKSFHLISGQTVAIKQCRMSDTKQILDAFVAESEYYAEFDDNKYIVDMLGFGRNSEHKLCIALEYMDQGSLCSIKYALSEAHLQYIAYSILNALICVHGKRYIHNDIKPDNILISSRGEVKLSDFGCCIKMKKNQDFMSQIIGSKQYYAPEKWSITPPKYDTKSDIFSFGVSMYELVTLTMTNNRESAFYEAPKMDKLHAKWSKNLCDFISKMLIWDFKDRPSASELLEHSFLRMKEKIKAKAFAKSVKKENDLSFMIDSLIEYYSNKSSEWMMGTPKESDVKKRVIEYSDKEIIENLSKHSGCTEKEVTTMIKYAVNNTKQKINAKPIRKSSKANNAKTIRLIVPNGNT